MPERIIIFLNGEFNPPPNLPPNPDPEDVIIATDGGIKHVLNLGWSPQILLGDFDSTPFEILTRLKGRSSLRLYTFPVEKDKTDFELTLDFVLKDFPNAKTVIIFGALGKRWDMTLSNLILPVTFFQAYPKSRKKPHILFWDAHTIIHLLEGPNTLQISPEFANFIFSLIPLSPIVKGVTLNGNFKYPLKEGDLLFGHTLGLSNVILEDAGSVSFKEGYLGIFLEPPEKEDSHLIH
ncbi:MAG: thiamine diphosphokinase [Deltaproteobacteria bacterium]|jgi:thiamine pyrophosphokinase|nr:thiamine diphosphokinase [Deltaproteobacteria bacterium]